MKYIELTLVCLSTIFFFAGCKEYPEKTDITLNLLQERLDSNILTTEERELADLAMSNYKNSVVNDKPILIEARLMVDKPEFILSTFDENKDIIGITIREEHRDSSNSSSFFIEEDYQAYVHCNSQEAFEISLLPVQIRTPNRRKDEELWKQYSLQIPNKKIIEDFYINKIKSGNHAYPDEFWKETLPPVLVSVPNPNNINVWISLYDRKGNKSEPVSLSLYEWGE